MFDGKFRAPVDKVVRPIGAGLPVCRYDPEALAAELAPDFELVSGAPLVPTSGRGDQRPYVGVVLRRTGEG